MALKIVILGSKGYLGKYISDSLTQNTNHFVYRLNRGIIDLTNTTMVQDWLNYNNPDVIVNLAVAGGNQNVDKVSYEDLQNNLNIFLNFYNNSKYFKKFINIGSGSEFDTRANIDRKKEEDIFKTFPLESYAYSKNIISRLSKEKENFYTLRLFGCFDKSEPDFRLLKKFPKEKIFSFLDREFDYISASDFYKILLYYIENDNLIKDINCVYDKKLKLSEILNKFKAMHHIDTEVKIEGINNFNYTGDFNKLKSLPINLEGIDKGLEFYYRKDSNDSI